MRPTRAQWLLAARIVFVLATIACAWWGFRGRGDEVGAAISEVTAVAVAVAMTLTLVGLAATAVLWRLLLRRVGSDLPPADAAAVFFLGQLGKYLPGSVWSFAAQAHLARRHDVPARHTLAASAVFLVVHTFTGVALGAGMVASGVLTAPGPRWLWALVALGGAVALLPSFVRPLGSRIAGPNTRIAFGGRDLVVTVGLMLTVWISYGGALVALLGPNVERGEWAGVVGAFALAHAAGVLLVFAPAGLGAREGVLILLLGPVVGTGPAAAAALLARVVHSAADFLAAGVSVAAARRSVVPEGTITTAPGVR